MEKVFLNGKIRVNNIETNVLELDFDKITGRVMMETETKCRSMGDNTPDLTFSMKYQAMLAAKAAGIIYDDLLDLSGKDMALILTEVKNFFISTGFRTNDKRGEALKETRISSDIKKVAIACAIATFTSIEFYINISINEMLDYADEIGKMQDKSTKS